MVMARWTGVVQDAGGNAIAGASIEVRREGDNALVPLFSDREGEYGLSNPFTADDATVYFHAAGGSYRIKATKGSFEQEWRYVAIGTAGETDAEQFQVDFSDGGFRLHNTEDETSRLAFDLSEIASDTTRTLVVPNGSGTLPLLEKAQTFSQVQTFSAIPVLSGGGIRFPATQVPSSNANVLDDYEEGTFTPIVKGSTSAGTASYINQEARYTKIGDAVLIKLACGWQSGTGTGNLNIGGVPFNAAAGVARSVLSVVVSNLALSSNNTVTALKTSENADISIEQMPAGGGALAAVPYDAIATVVITGVYWV